MIVYIPESEEIDHEAIKLLKESKHQVISNIKDIAFNQVEVLFIRTYIVADKEYLKKFPNLKFILKAGVGLDNIDVDEARNRKIQIINAPGSNSNAVAELVVCLMLMLLRNTKQQSHRLRQGGWRSKALMGEELKRKIVGFIGCGAIARSVTEKIRGFNVSQILGYDPYLDEKALASFGIKKVDLQYLIENSDIISLHLPLTAETKDLITLKEIKKMKEKAYIINTSRGGIINEKDLIVALQNKMIAGAALDVFENEPNINAELLTLENIILTPHLGAYTFEANKEMAIAPVRIFLSSMK